MAALTTDQKELLSAALEWIRGKIEAAEGFSVLMLSLHPDGKRGSKYSFDTVEEGIAACRLDLQASLADARAYALVFDAWIQDEKSLTPAFVLRRPIEPADADAERSLGQRRFLPENRAPAHRCPSRCLSTWSRRLPAPLPRTDTQDDAFFCSARHATVTPRRPRRHRATAPPSVPIRLDPCRGALRIDRIPIERADPWAAVPFNPSHPPSGEGRTQPWAIGRCRRRPDRILFVSPSGTSLVGTMGLR